MGLEKQLRGIRGTEWEVLEDLRAEGTVEYAILDVAEERMEKGCNSPILLYLGWLGFGETIDLMDIRP